MDITKFALAVACGAETKYALLYALDIIPLVGEGMSGDGYLLLSPGKSRLILSGYGKDIYLKLTEG